jgi:phage terminase large subunit-like protein
MPMLLASLDTGEAEAFQKETHLFVHDHQAPPPGPWTTWLLLGGRGAGKTYAGAQWVKSIIEKVYPIALVGETEHDVREVMVEGVSGILAAYAGVERPQWIPSRRRIEWRNGNFAQAFSAEDPESLRGPQFAAAWCDEFAKWRHADATFDMLQFGLRLGERPRQTITTTPRPIPLLKRLIGEPTTAVTHARTHDNAFNLSAAFFDAVLTRYAGTRLGRQELDGEIIDERPDALWSRELLERCLRPRRRGARGKRLHLCARRRDRVGAHAGRLGAQVDRPVAQAVCRCAGGRGESGRRHGARGNRGSGSHCAGDRGAGAARQVAARRAGGGFV